MTKLNGKLPEGTANGLGYIGERMVDQPETQQLVIMVIDTQSITTNVDSGDIEATARIRRIEPIVGQDRALAVQLFRRANQERTGRDVLPLDVEDQLTAALTGINPRTGEVTN